MADHTDGRIVRTQQRSYETRRAIAEAAADQFAKYGFSGASLRDIAELAETKHQLIGYHFGSKRDLFWTVVRSESERYIEVNERYAAADWEDPERTFEDYLVEFFSVTVAHPELILMMAKEETTGGDSRGSEIWLTASLESVGRVVRLAAERGALPADLDLTRALATMHLYHVFPHIYPVQTQVMFGEQRDVRERVLDVVFMLQMMRRT